MTCRRQALAALGTCVLVTPYGGFAQSPRVYRIGWISLGKADAPSPFLDAFRQGLRAQGYVEGRDVIVEARFADGSRERADELVTALVRSKVDVIVTQGGALRGAIRHGRRHAGRVRLQRRPGRGEVRGKLREARRHAHRHELSRAGAGREAP